MSKVILIDPNNINGDDSASNIFVPNEDLNIFVQLSTFRKERTVLTSDGKNSNVTSVPNFQVNFIEGAKVNGEKVLTTKYTDLTTDFDDDSGAENLGITNIDIDFSSAMAPMININFIDVRGGAIYQNEDKIKKLTTKYSVLFELPYPIFNLTIKGYYGLPVTYCLHMTKYNSKFNSQTGNFEITASFIGYTYAMLSDMLIGFLKAVPYTSIGKTIFENYKDKDGKKLLTLDELQIKISDINKLLPKIKATNKNAQDVTLYREKQSTLDDIRRELNILGINIMSISEDLYPFIFYDKNYDVKSYISKYEENITSEIEKYNSGGNKISLILTDFNSVEKLTYKDLSIDLLESSVPSERLKLAKILEKSNNIGTTKEVLLDYLKKNNSLASSTVINVIDMRNLYVTVNNKNNDINSEIKLLQTKLGEEAKNEVTKALDFDPTIRNLVSIFCAQVEVFLKSLHNVAKSATANSNRTSQLEKLITANNSDIKSDSIENVGNTNGETGKQFYPWPAFNKAVDGGGYIEAYIGSEPNTDNVDEVIFINDLLKAFLTSGKNTQDALQIQEQNETNWYPVNPVDTRLFIDTFPYNRKDFIKQTELLNYMMIRATTFLGFTNKSLTATELQSMANKEAEAVFTNVKNDLVLQSLKTLKLEDFTKVGGPNGFAPNGFIQTFKPENSALTIINGNGNNFFDILLPIPISTGSNVKVLYRFMSPTSVVRILPIDTYYDYNKTDDEYLAIKGRAEHLFLTNYKNTTVLSSGSNSISNILANPNNIIQKPYDGGIYMKIFSRNEYDANTKPLITTPENSDSVILLSKLSLPERDLNASIIAGSSGFNIFGGNYGIQEYRTLDYGDGSVSNFRYMFYTSNNSDDGKSLSNGLAYTRLASVNNKKSTYYDYLNDKGETRKRFSIFDKLEDYREHIYGLNNVALGTHSNYGSNLFLSVKQQDLSYPFINFQIYDEYFGDVPISLFGSKFYYGQQTDYAKALLFLHTFPWKGIVSDDIEKGIFDVNEILNTFSNRGGFISVPKLWPAFIGSMLWRADNRNVSDGGSGPVDPIVFGNVNGSFLPGFTFQSFYPTRYNYLVSRENTSMSFDQTATNEDNYKPIDATLLSLPDQVKDEFKKSFFEFVNGADNQTSDWAYIKSELEIANPIDINDWDQIYDKTVANTGQTPNIGGKTYILIPITNITSNLINIENYITIVPNKFTKDYLATYSTVKANIGVLYNNNYSLELKDGTNIMNYILGLYDSEVIISNSTYRIWSRANITDITPRSDINVSLTDLKIYVNTIIAKFTELGNSVKPDVKKKQLEQNLFGTADEQLIKFQLYKTCKSIYDKWVGGSDDDNILFQCGTRNKIDEQLAIKSNRSGALQLIDSFRFVSRSFKDIGDTFFVNPLPINNFLLNNPNSSFYDAITSLLSANNFDFVPLPTYINYNNQEELKNAFKPYNYTKDSVFEGSGPSFVCVYVGESSKNLDIKGGSYSNDGFDFGSTKPAPADYEEDAASFENNVAVFSVEYGKQNQSVFKDISLDQSEFGETAESLQITDAIANNGSENSVSLAGQNIYNVYSVRSYKAEVEMMGNPMIQPMMYFQLNNIPMFHGAYFITKVRHNIRPNYMSTTFTGVRVRSAQTPLIDVGVVYMSLLDSIEVSTEDVTTFNNSDTTISVPNSVAISELKGRISSTNFTNYNNIKFTEYGTN